MLLLTTPAAAAVTVSAGATLITIEGTAGNDATVLSDEGSNVWITNATAQGANCTQSGADALCPRGSRTISANLLGGDDDFDNRSSAVAGVTAGPGADMLIGRLRAADAGDGLDIMRPSGMTGVVSLAGGAEFDIYDIGADTGASDVVTDTGAFKVDYLSRPAASGGVTLTPNNNLDDEARPASSTTFAARRSSARGADGRWPSAREWDGCCYRFVWIVTPLGCTLITLSVPGPAFS